MRSKTGQGLSASVQGFCDVSVREYATVVYLRKETLEGTYPRFVTSKTMVAPLHSYDSPLNTTGSVVEISPSEQGH